MIRLCCVALFGVSKASGFDDNIVTSLEKMIIEEGYMRN
jgi:hypothetical protein